MKYEKADLNVGSVGEIGLLNVPKDLSILNRRGYASTTRKGVPLVYQCKVDFYLHDDDGLGPTDAMGADVQGVLTLDGCVNNWVMRNAAVKWHAAREAMFKDAGVSKNQRGAYSHEIRYNFDSNGDSFLSPIDGDGNAFTGGTWDVSTLSYGSATSFQLGLVSNGDNEEADSFAGDYLQIGHSYLVSRLNQQADTNLEGEEGPAKFSVLQRMLGGQAAFSTIQDEVTGAARDEQDNPPYEVLDISDSGDVGHDITEKVELGRAVAGFGNAYGSCIVEIPFGIARLQSYLRDANGTNAASGKLTPGMICVEVLDIYEMQG
tara:strand:+ start:85 stop:1041 length:957 start_codon:yes stop_codon:yes gene_type:complete